jgi:hypothetical protein
VVTARVADTIRWCAAVGGGPSARTVKVQGLRGDGGVTRVRLSEVVGTVSGLLAVFIFLTGALASAHRYGIPVVHPSAFHPMLAGLGRVAQP